MYGCLSSSPCTLEVIFNTCINAGGISLSFLPRVPDGHADTQAHARCLHHHAGLPCLSGHREDMCHFTGWEKAQGLLTVCCGTLLCGNPAAPLIFLLPLHYPHRAAVGCTAPRLGTSWLRWGRDGGSDRMGLICTSTIWSPLKNLDFSTDKCYFLKYLHWTLFCRIWTSNISIYARSREKQDKLFLGLCSSSSTDVSWFGRNSTLWVPLLHLYLSSNTQLQVHLNQILVINWPDCSEDANLSGHYPAFDSKYLICDFPACNLLFWLWFPYSYRGRAPSDLRQYMIIHLQ